MSKQTNINIGVNKEIELKNERDKSLNSSLNSNNLRNENTSNNNISSNNNNSENNNNLDNISLNNSISYSIQNINDDDENADGIIGNNNFIMFYVKYFMSTFLIFFYHFMTHLFNLIFMQYTPKTDDFQYQNDAYNLSYSYCLFFFFSFSYLPIYVLEIKGTLAYSTKKYRKFGYLIHYTLLSSIAICIVLYVINIFVCGVFLNFFLPMSQETIDYFYLYVFVIVFSYLFDLIFIIYSRLLNITDHYMIVSIIVLINLGGYCLLSYILIVTCELGIKGIIIAKTIFSFLSFLLILLYILFSYKFPSIVFFFKRESFNIYNIWDYLVLTFFNIPLILSFNGILFFSIYISLWFSQIYYYVNTIFNLYSYFIFCFTEANSVTLVVVTTYFIGKGVSKSILKQILGYSMLFLGAVIIISIILNVIIESWIINLVNSNVKRGSNINTISILHNNNFYIKMEISDKVWSDNVYFFLMVVFFSFNRLFYSWYRSIGMMFVGMMNPLILGFVYKLGFIVLFGKIFSIFEEGLLIGIIVADILGIIISIIQYLYEGWVKLYYNYSMKTSINKN